MARAVCVLGFHRSGTSLTTRLLNLLGVHLGPEEDLLPPHADDNPRGYWEPRWMTELNDAILAALGGGYRTPPPLEPGWERLPALEPLREQARALVAERLATAPLWGFKDPRTCLTLPFWREVVAERGDDLVYVLCLRSPSGTAASMMRRPQYAGIEAGTWGDLWLEYTGRALEESAQARRLVVFYDDLVAAGGAEAERLAAFLEQPWPAGERRARLEEAIESQLRHHVAPSLETARDGRLPAEARAAFLALRAAAEGPRGDDGAALADALEEVALQLWRSRRATVDQARVGAGLRDALVDAVGAVQRADVREDAVAAELIAARERLVTMEAGLAQARAAARATA